MWAVQSLIYGFFKIFKIMEIQRTTGLLISSCLIIIFFAFCNTAVLVRRKLLRKFVSITQNRNNGREKTIIVSSKPMNQTYHDLIVTAIHVGCPIINISAFFKIFKIMENVRLDS